MKRSTFLKSAALAFAAPLALSACNSGDKSANDSKTLRVGALPVPAGDMLKYVAKTLAPKQDITIEYKEFSDYNTPNAALTDGDIDANLFQNTTFMETYNKASKGDLVAVGKVYLPPMALYSNKYRTIAELPASASVAIPNDPTNEGRALALLDKEGLITVKKGGTTLKDITANPRNIKFTEVENASLPQALADQDAAIVTLAFALPAGLKKEQQVVVEAKDSPYYNVLAVRKSMVADPRVKKLFEMLTGTEMKTFLQDKYKGLVIPA